MDSILELRNKVKEFNAERDWDKYHNPKDLIVALMSEVGELAELYRWLNEEEMNNILLDPLKKEKVESELADITMYLMTLSYKTNTDLFKAVEKKMEKINKRYPVEKIKGLHTNPLTGFKSKED